MNSPYIDSILALLFYFLVLFLGIWLCIVTIFHTSFLFIFVHSCLSHYTVRRKETLIRVRGEARIFQMGAHNVPN